jgi:hypothetical protein
MILPLALVERWPSDEYKKQHDSIESALKHNVADTLALTKDLKILKEVESYLTDLTIPDTKEEKLLAKRLGKETIERKFTAGVVAKNDRLQRLIKNSDYPAMIMAAYPEAKFLDKSKYREIQHEHRGDVLIRGISSGPIGDVVRARGDNFYFIETGYLGNYPSSNNETGRKIYHRIVKNAMQHSNIMDVPNDRWRALCKFDEKIKLPRWKRHCRNILIVAPSEKPCQYYGINKDEWLTNTVETLKRYTDRPIIVREKASRGERTNDTIYQALRDDVFATVTYNSIAAVESVSLGIPAFALAPTAAAPVCSDDLTKIENPYYPDIQLVHQWLFSIAYSQFSLDELITGKAWRMVLENAERSTVNY